MNDKGFFQGFYKGIKSFGENISILVNSILLTIVYLVGVGLTSLCAGFADKNFLEKEISPEKKSYWSELDIRKKTLEEYYRQF